MQAKFSAYLSSARDEWQQKFARDRARLLKNPFFARSLKTLSEAGADQEKVIALIYYTLPVKREIRGWPYFIRKAQGLRALARELERDASSLEEVYSSSLNFAEFWRGVTFPGEKHESQTSEELKLIPRRVITDMRFFAKRLDEEATRFAENSRSSGRAADDFYVQELLRYIFRMTGKYHERVIADLLQLVHGEFGSNREFSSEQLKKMRQRHLRNLAHPKSR